MRGHTSNRVLKANLTGMFRDAQAEAKERANYPVEVEYFTGKADACVELWCFLGLEENIHVQAQSSATNATDGSSQTQSD